MAESTLSINRGIIERELRRFLQYALTGTLLTDQDTNIDDIIHSGERAFYEPAIDGKPYCWSFLTKIETITTANGTATYALTDGFAGFLDKELTFAAANTKPWPLLLVPLEHVLEKIQDGTGMPSGLTVAQPLIGAVAPVTFATATGQRQQITLWPTPNSILSITGRCRLIPDATPDVDADYPMGGQPHAQTLLECCLAAAEAFMNDEEGVHTKRAAERLAASIALDMRLHPQETP